MQNSKNIKFEIIKKLAEVKFKYKELGKISHLDSTSPPSVFIGSKLKYPAVNVGILSPLSREKDAWIYDDAKYWADNNFQINDVLRLRDSLLNSRFQTNVKQNKNKFINIAQEIAIASKPVDIEIDLNKKINPDRKKDKILMHQGFKGNLKKAKITSNVRVHRKVDKVINDEIKASEGIRYLYKNKFDENTLSKILSVGVLGLKKNKRLVPTRGSITATDDTIGKSLIENIKEYRLIENYELFFGEFLGNQYLIMLFPNVWSFELFELYLPGSSWNPSRELKASTDVEFYNGRKSYATATAGGYYATRLSILEYLNKIKKQASAIVIRLETPSYWAGLGVWVVRESVRKSLKNRKIEFPSIRELTESAKQIGKAKFNFNPESIFKKSRLLNYLKTQTNLMNWF